MPPQIQGIVILYQQDLLNILGDDGRLENVGIFILPPYKARDQVEKNRMHCQDFSDDQYYEVFPSN